jgi:hypothetical protein
MNTVYNSVFAVLRALSCSTSYKHRPKQPIGFDKGSILRNYSLHDIGKIRMQGLNHLLIN